VSLLPDKIIVEVQRETVITKNEETRKFESFQFDVKSPAYNLGSIAMEIASQESTYCNFNYLGYTLIYPRYKIIKQTGSRANKFYLIQDTKSGKYMQIAIRSCAIPAGM
jgi:hypothetical protein